jgi:thioredoxin reductase (NADPH)
MFDYDVIIIGGGPAGLTAGIYLARARYRALVLEKESFGGQLKNIEWIENYPGFADGTAGLKLGTEMMNQAAKYGAELKQGEVTGIDSFSNTKYVNCSDGKGYTCAAVVIAGGAKSKKLGVPGEDAFKNKGLIHCALCDGGRFAGGIIAVCGGGDAGITEALYLTKMASKVILIEAMPKLTASAILQERALAEPKIEVRCGERVLKITGKTEVEAIETDQTATGKKEIIKVNGVLVHVGIDPNTDYLDGTIPLDETGQVIVNNRLETEVASIYGAGDIRKDSPRQVAAAVGDGTIAAITAQRFLQSIRAS